MIQLWILMALSLGLAWLHENAYMRTRDHMLEKQRISVPFIIMVVLLGGFLGLRVAYNDTSAYQDSYIAMKTFPDFWSTFNPSLSKDPGFNLCNAALKTLSVSTQNWLMIYALITIALYLHFIRKNRNDLLLNIFLFFCVGSFTFSGAAIKQSIATTIGLCALPLAIDKKWVKYFVMIALASTFHVYTVIYLLVPFLMFKPWTKRTVFLVIGTVIMAFSLRSVFGTITSITTTLGESYTIGSFNGEGVNFFRVLVCNVPLFLAAMFHKDIFKDSTRSENLMFNLSMINGCIMFIGLFGTANYFGRLANFFVAAQAITLPGIINKISGKNSELIKIVMILGYLGYFYYSCDIVYGRFSSIFHRLTVFEYLQELF